MHAHHLRRHLVRSITLALSLTLLTVACSSDGEESPDADEPADDSSDDPESGAGDEAGDGAEAAKNVVFQAFPADPAAIPVLIMQEEGIDEEYGFEAELLTVDPDAALNTFLIGESDVATEQDLVTTAIARQEGHESVAFYPVLNMATGIVVPGDSPYETPEDLVGANVGHFGVDSGTTTGIALMLSEIYDIDVFEDFELSEAGPEALPELLANGEVEAFMDFQPLLVRGVLLTEGEYLFDSYTEWSEGPGDGWAPWLTNLTARKEWIEEDPDLAVSVRDAWAEAQAIIIESNYDILEEEPYASALGLRDEEEVQGYITYCQEIAPCFADSWTEEDRAKGEEWVEMMQQAGFLVTEVPESPTAVDIEEYVEQLQ